MNEQDFVARRRVEWDRLLFLIDRGETSLHSLKGKHIHEFARLYRRVAADLATVRTQGTNPSLLRYLNDLIVRGHGILYRHPRRSIIRGLLEAIVHAASVVRKRQVFVHTALLVTLASAAFAFAFVRGEPESLAEFMPGDFSSSLEQWKQGTFGDLSAEQGMGKTGFYIGNNTMATIWVASGGVTFGLLSLYILFMNGAMLGVFVHEIGDAGQLVHFGAGVLPHGVTELGGIFIAGGAGLMMGWALINPGRRRRLESLTIAGKDAVYMIALGIVMIWMAAPIEGWFSHLPGVPNFFKYLFAAVSLGLWLAYFAYVGRRREPATQEP